MERVVTAKPAYKIDEAASLLGLTAQTVRFAVRDGRIPAFRIGRRWFIPREQLDRLLNGEATT